MLEWCKKHITLLSRKGELAVGQGFMARQNFPVEALRRIPSLFSPCHSYEKGNFFITESAAYVANLIACVHV